MSESRNLRREVSKELVQRGYRRFGRMHLLPVHEAWSFGVDTGPLGARADVTPFVGVRYDALERLLAELLSLPADETSGSIGANVGYILDGKYRSWPADAALGEVLAAVDAAFGLMRPIMQLDRLADGWKMKTTQDPLWRYREIVLLLLQQDAHQVKAKLAAAREVICAQEDELAVRFRKFEERVLQRLQGSATD